MKRVLFVIETLRGGGAERALSNICTHFPTDWQIDILVNDESLIEYPYRGTILSLSKPEKRSAIYYIGNIIRRAFYLRRLKRKNEYAACISFLDSANISNVLSGRGHCKVIVSIRNNMVSEKLRSIEGACSLLLTKILYTHADKIVVVSKEIASSLVSGLKVPANKVAVVTNGFDCEEIRKGKALFSKEAVAADLIAKRKKIVVTVGRIVEVKGHWHLIRAFSEVARKEPEAVLLIVGDGPLKGYLSELIDAYGLTGKVLLIGRSDNPYWYDAIADVFVLSSLSEGYPNALAEAVCCGTPCIATDVHSGPREILAPSLDVNGSRVTAVWEAEYGILVPECSGRKYDRFEALEEGEQKMSEAILMLLHDSEKRNYYRRKGIERSKALSIDSAVSNWVNLILE